MECSCSRMASKTKLSIPRLWHLPNIVGHCISLLLSIMGFFRRAFAGPLRPVPVFWNQLQSKKRNVITHITDDSCSQVHPLSSPSSLPASVDVAPHVKQAPAPTPPRRTAKGMGLGMKTVPEVLEPISLVVVGNLPEYLGKGAYYRNGPGRFEVTHSDGVEHVAQHWFDGLGMIQAFFFDAEHNTVTYRSRLVAESVVRTIEATPSYKYSSIQALQNNDVTSWFARLKRALRPLSKDPMTGEVPADANVSLQSLPRKGLLNATTDGNVIYKLNPLTLESEGRYDYSVFNEKLKRRLSQAHGMLDEKTGEFFNFMLDLGVGKSDYTVFRILPSGEGQVMMEFRDDPFYVHSFSLTENYIVLILCPYHIDLATLILKRSFIASLSFDDSISTKFVVISRNTNDVVCTYEYESFFSFHTINAYEHNDGIAIDLSCMKDPLVLNKYTVENMRKSDFYSELTIPVRFQLPNLAAAMKDGPEVRKKATVHRLADLYLDFGSVAPSVQQRKHRYIYGVSDNGGKQLFGDVTKLDTTTGSISRWGSPGVFFGEPVFVADPHGIKEDDGSLLTLVLDSVQENSALVVLDASTMKETARAIVSIPLPLGFHGMFLKSPNSGQ